MNKNYLLTDFIFRYANIIPRFIVANLRDNKDYE